MRLAMDVQDVACRWCILFDSIESNSGNTLQSLHGQKCLMSCPLGLNALHICSVDQKNPPNNELHPTSSKKPPKASDSSVRPMVGMLPRRYCCPSVSDVHTIHCRPKVQTHLHFRMSRTATNGRAPGQDRRKMHAQSA